MSNVCPCPNPPGGQIVCSDNQLALCAIRNGQIVSGCFDKPRDRDLMDWAVLIITGVQRPTTPDDLNMLRSGRYVNPVTGEPAVFRLPRQSVPTIWSLELKRGSIDRAALPQILTTIKKEIIVPDENEFSMTVEE